MGFARVLLSLLALAGASALQLQPMMRVAAVSASPLRVPAAPRCQFGQKKDDTEQKGISRDNEPEEFFASDWGARTPPRMTGHRPMTAHHAWAACADDLSDAEKLKSPVVIGGIALIVGPFIIGAIALAAGR
tara:strand:+ start:301 stop:696 length:396 start_codon:yes stop_codon:yes gene_type:complete